MSNNSKLLEKSQIKSQANLLTQGSIWQAIWIMSWPLLLTTTAGSIVGMVDIQVAGLISSAAQAAVGLAEQILFLFMILIMSISVGTTAIVSRSYGSGDKKDYQLSTAQSLALATILGITCCLLSILVAQFILPLFSNSKTVINLGTLYLSIFSVYLIPFSICSIISAAFRAIGDTKSPLFIMLIVTTITIIGDYVTVVGNWPIAGLGVKGIALSGVTGSTIGSILFVWRLSESTLKESFQNIFPLSLDAMRRIINIGLPSGLQRFSWACAVFVLFFILSRCQYPTAALASWSIGMRVEGLIFMPLMAFSLAVSSIVGQNLGAKRVRRAFQAGWHVTSIGISLMVVLGLLLFVFAEPFAKLMTNDLKTIEYTASYLRINALAEPFLAVAMILSGALQGAGDTRSPMWISMFTNWLIRLPLAWYLALILGLGPTGAWIAMTVSIVLMGITMAFRFQSRLWVKIRI